MAELRRVPPGRAGRLWLVSRLRAGRHAADLLDRKLRILRGEQERFQLQAQRTGAAWEEASRRADEWLVRGALLGGQRELRLSTPPGRPEVSVSWTSIMGVRYPVEATCRLPEPSAADRGPGSAALVEAAEAHRAAVIAAAAHAAAEAARRIVEAEVAVTHRRLRAITDRWVPRLEDALRERVRSLDETERTETFRLRWAADHLDRERPSL